jgi:hypothetical protein
MDDDRLPRDYKTLKRHNPDLIPSPEEEMDEELVSFYDLVREFYAMGEELRDFSRPGSAASTARGVITTALKLNFFADKIQSVAFCNERTYPTVAI